jgi:hypothetical protein
MNGVEMSRPYEVKEHCPLCPGEVAYYTEVLFNGEFKIPDLKPDLEQIIHINRQVFINKIAPVPVKLNNGHLVGGKILVRGMLRIGLEYAALVPEQTVHFLHLTIPFEGLITKDCCLNPIPLQDWELRKFNLYTFVEHITAERIDPRTIEKTLVLLIWLKRKEHCSEQEPLPTEECELLECGLPITSKQLKINQKLVIPPEKPPIAEILSTSSEITIKRGEIINTPLIAGPCAMPLKKVIVTGTAEIMIKYADEGPDQQVHAEVFHIPIRTLIEWPGGPSSYTPLCVHVTEEYFHVDLHDKRHLFAALVLHMQISRNEHMSNVLI